VRALFMAGFGGGAPVAWLEALLLGPCALLPGTLTTRQGRARECPVVRSRKEDRSGNPVMEYHPNAIDLSHFFDRLRFGVTPFASTPVQIGFRLGVNLDSIRWPPGKVGCRCPGRGGSGSQTPRASPGNGPPGPGVRESEQHGARDRTPLSRSGPNSSTDPIKAPGFVIYPGKVASAVTPGIGQIVHVFPHDMGRLVHVVGIAFQPARAFPAPEGEAQRSHARSTRLRSLVGGREGCLEVPLPSRDWPVR
jgi:hypothetical protein